MPPERSRDRSQHLHFRVVNSSLYAANMATSFLLMLAVMTYNAGFFAAVVVGLGLGHFFASNSSGITGWQHCCETAVGPVDF